MLTLELMVVLALFMLNGFFAMAEFAIVSSRRSHLAHLLKEGRPGAQAALALIDDPARMLAAVQIGFTTSAILAGIFSGATLAERLEEALLLVPRLDDDVHDVDGLLRVHRYLFASDAEREQMIAEVVA